MRAARAAFASMATARSDGSASSHSIATEPEPAPTSQSNSLRRGRQRRQRHRANFALGDLTVMLEQRVGQARRTRENARARRRLDLKRHDIERVDIGERKIGGASGANALATARPALPAR